MKEANVKGSNFRSNKNTRKEMGHKSIVDIQIVLQMRNNPRPQTEGQEPNPTPTTFKNQETLD